MSSFPRKRAWNTAAVLALLAALAVGIGLALHQDERELRALSALDGGLVAVTGGRELPVVGPNWRRWLGADFPGLKIERTSWRLPGQPSVPVPALTAWATSTRGLLADDDNSGPSLPVELTDDWGGTLRTILKAAGPREVVDIPGAVPYWPWRSSPALGPLLSLHPGHAWLAALPVSQFPRRGRSVRVRPLGSSAELSVPDLVVPNPLPGPYPTWAPEQLPAHRRNGSLEMVLRRFTTGNDPARGDLPQTELLLGLAQGGRTADRHWSVERWSLSDPTGNRWEGSSSALPAGDGGVELALPDTTLPDEPAYGVRVEVARLDGFSPADLCVARNLPLPPKGRILPCAFSSRCHGCTVEVTQLIGAGATNIAGITPYYPAAEVHISGPLRQFVLRASSSAGRGVPSMTFPDSNQSGCFLVDLLGQPGVPVPSVRPRAVDLTLALTPVRVFEFRAHARQPSRRTRRP